MKRNSFMMALLLMVAGFATASAQEWNQAMKVWNGSSFTIHYLTGVDSVQFVRMVTGVTISETSLELTKGDTRQLTATVLPEDADDRSIVWESSNAVAVSVTQDGFLTAANRGKSTITCRAADGSGREAQCVVMVKSDVPFAPEAVDLGLPSGTLWATCNVGAESPEETGDYFAWAETSPKEIYTWATYRWMQGGYDNWNGISKYTFDDGQQSGCWYEYDEEGEDYFFIGDDLTELQPEDDAATVNWGSEWQMPSKEQIDELFNNEYTSKGVIEINGVWGTQVTSLFNGNSIFLPRAGRMQEEIQTAEIWYWSRTMGESMCDIVCCINTWGATEMSRSYGMPVRPVRKQ